MENELEHLQSVLRVQFAQHSEAGVKPENQDTVGARIPEGPTLSAKGIAIAIADGVSSSSSARQASQLAITGFLTDYFATPDTWRTQRSAIQVIQSLNRYLWAQSQNSVRQEGHLTTFSALILKGNTAFTFHVGDSRIYRFREGHLEQITRDHTQKIDRRTSYLSRALGADPSLEIDMTSVEMQVGDVFLLTTDGIHDFIVHTEMCSLVDQHQNSIETLVETLLQRAHEHKSDDNISLQACRIEALGTASQSDAVAALSRLPFPPILEVGNILDGFSIRKIMHESERSQVYSVVDNDGQAYVMKTPSINYVDDPAYTERFVLESWIGARIQNPHVVRVVEPPHARNFLYYLTEHIAGPTLAQLIKQRAPFDIPDAIELIEQIIKGARAFHRKDTLHQDLKPENIIIGSRGAVIIDFGSCWVAGIDELQAPFKRDTILGTLDYSAPEYRCGGTKSQKSDQFSLAAIFYEMVTGKKPYGEGYANAMDLKAFQRLHYCPAPKLNPLVPIWLDRAIEKAVSIHPNGRYSALSEWLGDLKRPNPNWTNPREQPLIERDPILFWKILSALGWTCALTLGFLLLNRPV